jgi:hypothetical protein
MDNRSPPKIKRKETRRRIFKTNDDDDDESTSPVRRRFTTKKKSSSPKRSLSPENITTTTTAKRSSPNLEYQLKMQEQDEELEARIRSLSSERFTTKGSSSPKRSSLSSERFAVPIQTPKKQVKRPTPKLEIYSEKHRLLDKLIKRNPKYAQEISNIIEKVDFTPKTKSGVVSSPRGLQSPSSKKTYHRIGNISSKYKKDLFGAKKSKQTPSGIPKDLESKVITFYNMISNPLISSNQLINLYKQTLDEYSLQKEYRDYIYQNSYEIILKDINLMQNRTELLDFLDNELKKKIQQVSKKSRLQDMFGNFM